jgi:hypothetical protein
MQVKTGDRIYLDARAKAEPADDVFLLRASDLDGDYANDSVSAE